MSSTTASMPSCSASIRPRRSESSDESRSGMNSPSTFSLPSARTRERSDDRAVDAARQADHDAAPPQRSEHLLFDRGLDFRDRLCDVEAKYVFRERHVHVLTFAGGRQANNLRSSIAASFWPSVFRCPPSDVYSGQSA